MANDISATYEAVDPPLGKPPSRRKLAALLFGLAFVHGLALNLMPILFPIIGKTFDLPKSQQGLLQTAYSTGMIMALVVAGYLVNYLGAKRVAIAVVSLAGLGAVLFGLVKVYVLVLAATMLMGIGMAALIAVYAAIVTIKFADVRQRIYMWTFAVLAGSATLSTSLTGYLVKQFGYNSVFIGFGIFIWIWLALLMLTVGRALDPEVGRAHLGCRECSTLTQTTWQKVCGFMCFLSEGLLNRGSLYLLGLLVILDTLASGNLLAWAPSYFSETHKMANIGLVLSASSGGVLIGRLVLGALPPGFISDRLLLGICYAGAMISFGVILLFQPGMYVSLGLIGLSGAFVSAQAPTTYSIAADKFGERAPAAIPLIDAIGNFGGMAGPPLLGFMADRTGDLRPAMWFIPICGFALVVLVLAWEAVDRARGVSASKPAERGDAF